MKNKTAENSSDVADGLENEETLTPQEFEIVFAVHHRIQGVVNHRPDRIAGQEPPGDCRHATGLGSERHRHAPLLTSGNGAAIVGLPVTRGDPSGRSS